MLLKNDSVYSNVCYCINAHIYDCYLSKYLLLRSLFFLTWVILCTIASNLTLLPPLLSQVQMSTMSTQICRVVQLMRSACCQRIRGRSCLRKAVLAPVANCNLCVPGPIVLHRRAYSLDSLSSGLGRPTLGPSPQQHCAERASPSSALTHRNLSAVAVQVGCYLRLCLTLTLQLTSFDLLMRNLYMMDLKMPVLFSVLINWLENYGKCASCN